MLPFLIHLGLRGEGVTPLRGIRWLQLKGVLPAAGIGCATVNSETMETGNTKGFLGIGVIVEIQSGIL